VCVGLIIGFSYTEARQHLRRSTFEETESLAVASRRQ
jgi:hypothetical protein